VTEPSSLGYPLSDDGECICSCCISEHCNCVEEWPVSLRCHCLFCIAVRRGHSRLAADELARRNNPPTGLPT
jgi:hypothetical protein